MDYDIDAPPAWHYPTNYPIEAFGHREFNTSTSGQVHEFSLLILLDINASLQSALDCKHLIHTHLNCINPVQPAVPV